MRKKSSKKGVKKALEENSELIQIKMDMKRKLAQHGERRGR